MSWKKNRFKHDDIEENSGVAGTKKSIDELCSTITNLKGKLQAVYQLPMFKNEKYKEQKVYPLRTSNLFVNHKRYKKLFHQMRTYREMGELVEETVQYSSYHKSSEIYEIWCYFKILEIFILEKGYVIDRISWPGKKEKPFVFESWENQDYSKVVHAIKKYIENREKRDSVKILDSREYSCKLKEAICGEDGRESKYEYRIASTKFLPGNDRGFYNLFYEAFEYGQAHFLKAVF